MQTVKVSEEASCKIVEVQNVIEHSTRFMIPEWIALDMLLFGKALQKEEKG